MAKLPPVSSGQFVLGSDDSKSVVFASTKPELFTGPPIPGSRTISELVSSDYSLVSVSVVNATDGTIWLYAIVRDNAQNLHSAWAQVSAFV